MKVIIDLDKPADLSIILAIQELVSLGLGVVSEQALENENSIPQDEDGAGSYQNGEGEDSSLDPDFEEELGDYDESLL